MRRTRENLGSREQPLLYNATKVRKACLLSANGHFTARALAKLYGALANGGSIDGVTLVSPARVQHMHCVVSEREDLVMGRPMRYGLVFAYIGPRFIVGASMLPVTEVPRNYSHCVPQHVIR
jgi:hypothetical protein